MSIRIFNRADGATVNFQDILVHGSSSVASGVMEVSHKDDSFPPQRFEVNSNFFKSVVHLHPGENKLIFTHRSGRFENGHAVIDAVPQFEPFAAKLKLTYEPLTKTSPIHLCLLVAKDSPCYFDSPKYRTRLDGNGVETAVRKLRFTAKLVTAFMEEQFARAGFPNRSFRFAEKEDYDTITSKSLPSYNNYARTVFIHVVELEQTFKEVTASLVNHDQLLNWATAALRKYGSPFAEKSLTKAICFFLDSHYDSPHTGALPDTVGYNIPNDLCCDIFIMGAHQIWSMPQNYEDMYAAFSETFPLDSGVLPMVGDLGITANTPWECANAAIGYFMLGIAGLLKPTLRYLCEGDPQDEDRLKWLSCFSRSFMSKEFYSSRTERPGFAPVLARDEFEIPRNVLSHLLLTPELRNFSDYNDPSLLQQPYWRFTDPPLCFAIEGGRILFTDELGVTVIELVDNLDKLIGHIDLLPRSCGGATGPLKAVSFTYEQLQQYVYQGFLNDTFSLKVYSLASFGSLYIKNPLSVIRDYKYGTGKLLGMGDVGEFPLFHTDVAGGDGGGDADPVFFNCRDVHFVRVFSSDSNVFGFQIHFRLSAASRFHRLRPQLCQFGEASGGYMDFVLNPGEHLAEVHVRCGVYVDALKFVANTGRSSDWYGNAEGGHLEKLLPAPGYRIVGFQGRHGAWIDAVGAFYARV